MAMAVAAAAKRDKKLRGIIVPSANAAEAAVVDGIDVIPVNSFSQTVAFLSGEIDIEAVPSRLDELFERALTLRRRLRRCPRPGDGEAGRDDRRGGWPQSPDGRPAWFREDHVGQTHANHSADALGRRVDRDDANLQRDGPSAGGATTLGQTTVPRPASHNLERWPGRRRFDAIARRNQPRPQRRALSRRAPRVQPHDARGAAAAARRWARDDQPGAEFDDVPGRFHADRIAKPLPLRLSQRPAARMPLLDSANRTLHGQDQRPAARPHRPPHRSAGRAVQRTQRNATRNFERHDAGASARSPRGANNAIC